MEKRELNKIQHRDCQLEIQRREDGSIESFSLSSEAPVRMPYGTEILEHSTKAINFERAKDGLPFLWRHNQDTILGRLNNIRLDGKKLRGDPVWSNNDLAQEKLQDVNDDILRDISLGYTVQRWDEDDDNLTAREWTPHEGSLTTVGADHTVGIGRNFDETRQEITTMSDENETENKGAGGEVIDFTNARELAMQQGRAEGVLLERERMDGIRALFIPEKFTGPGFIQLRETALSSNWTVEKTRSEMLSLIGEGTAPVTAPGQQDKRPSFEMGQDAYDKFREGAELALKVRGGLETDEKLVIQAREGGLIGLTMMELSREYLHMINVNTRSMSRRELAGAVFQRSLISHGTSDFTNILANVANKAALVGWTEAPETWNIWARTGNLSDFKTADRSGLGEFGDLDLIYENGEYKFATMNDRKEQLKLATYGKKISFSRESLINDDLGEFTTIPRKMGRAANRKVGDVAYAVLTGNPALNQDSTTLFHADHANVGTGGVPSVTTYNEMFKLMKLQKDNDAAAHGLNIVPRYVIGPVAVEATLDELNVNQYDPAATAGTLKKNPYSGRLTPVTDPRLDAASATAWYGLADQNMNDTIEVAFLDGVQAPYLEQVQGGDQDGVVYKVRIDAVAGPLGYQGAFYNAGA